MSLCPRKTTRGAFTLVELLVVISIIALLVGALLPAMSAVRNRAKTVQVKSQLNTLEQGVESYRGEETFGGEYPPSSSDTDTDDAVGRMLIVNPLDDSDSEEVVATGAHLLLCAMLGADLLGPPGFRDFNRNSTWADDTHAGEGGAYELDDTTGEEIRTRYGGGGYVSDAMREKHVRTLNELDETGMIAFWTPPPTPDTVNLPLFVDPWDRPILYYRANRGVNLMTGTVGTRGIYYQGDNGLITGTDEGSYVGIDFGPGGQASGGYHMLLNVDPPPLPLADITVSLYDNTFARFIHDESVIARREPVRKDSYLLITAGPDGVYGTVDDITNWHREEE
ncbi:MAG: type II secretion system protein [Planctomycetota bacterium]|jgi:prepilin-type N-terminal cleavage/methylation domain-containing protein